MNNQQNFVTKLTTALADNPQVQSFTVGFKTVRVNGEDEVVPDVQVTKKE